VASEKAHRGRAGEALENGRKNIPKIYTCPLFGAQKDKIEASFARDFCAVTF
jgi:hypothetical protein